MFSTCCIILTWSEVRFIGDLTLFDILNVSAWTNVAFIVMLSLTDQFQKIYLNYPVLYPDTCRYSGPTAAYAYAQMDPERVRKIFILGPSHHVYLDGCALSPATTYRTPFMDLPIDKGIYDELYKTGLFEEMSLGTDEDEHSIEMHLPYLSKVRKDE